MKKEFINGKMYLVTYIKGVRYVIKKLKNINKNS